LHIIPTGLSEGREEAGMGISLSLSWAGERFIAYKSLLPNWFSEKSWISLVAMIDLSESQFGLWLISLCCDQEDLFEP